MPTYTCTAASGLLNQEQKAAIARAVTRAHSEIGGAPSFFVQVSFQEAPEGDLYIGGVPLAHDHIFLYGRIRGGRGDIMRKSLIKRLSDDIAGVLGVQAFAVWVYLLELPAAAMVEFGHILPEAGEEVAWTKALPGEERKKMQAIEGRLAAADGE